MLKYNEFLETLGLIDTELSRWIYEAYLDYIEKYGQCKITDM